MVVPVHDGEAFVGDAVRSALAQDHRPVEVLVVDDGSTDGTADVVRGLAAPEVVLLQQENRGHGAAKNAGVARSRGAYLAFLDADDVWHPRKLRAQVEHLERHPALGFNVCLMRNVLTAAGAAALSPGQRQRLDGTFPAWLPSGLVVRRSAWEAVGTFDETLRHSNDTDWFARAQAADVRGAVVDEVLLDRRIHGANQTAKVDEIHAELLRVTRNTIAQRRSRG